ncbi:MAG: AAA family ATPase [Actinomycetes bacterium]
MPASVPSWLEPFRARIDAEVIETHISWVLLDSTHAYKVKKPVLMPFLDYTTAERRKFFCDQELRLNRRFAPQIYLDVVPIENTGEWAVRMVRFPEDQRADALCRNNKLTDSELSELAAAIHQLHERAPIAEPQTWFGTPEQVQANLDEHFMELRPSLPERAAQLNQLDSWTRHEVAARTEDLLRRKANGHIREGHGDLHLGNLVCLDGVITPFDCIEFNDDLRWLDVSNELAFTYLDLLRHNRGDAASWLLNEWLAISGDFDAMTVFRLYTVNRALVRAKVEVLSHNPQRAIGYMDLAQSLTEPPTPRLTITHGLSGSGKTTASAALVHNDPLAATIRLRSDIERKRLFGLAAEESSSSPVTGGIYSSGATEDTYTHLADICSDLLKAGWSVVVDAAFLRREHRQTFATVAADTGASFAILHCDAPVNELRSRIARRDHDASEATAAVLDHQLVSADPLTDTEWARVSGDGVLQETTGTMEACNSRESSKSRIPRSYK